MPANEITLRVVRVSDLTRQHFSISTFIWVRTIRNWLNRTEWTGNEWVRGGKRSHKKPVKCVDEVFGKFNHFSVSNFYMDSCARRSRYSNSFIMHCEYEKVSFFIRFDYICMIYWLHFQNMRRKQQSLDIKPSVIFERCSLVKREMWFVTMILCIFHICGTFINRTCCRMIQFICTDQIGRLLAHTEPDSELQKV